jgi:hypothetical protein
MASGKCEDKKEISFDPKAREALKVCEIFLRCLCYKLIP